MGVEAARLMVASVLHHTVSGHSTKNLNVAATLTPAFTFEIPAETSPKNLAHHLFFTIRPRIPTSAEGDS
jgi:hypothetical protein